MSCRVTILEMRLLPRESSRLYALVRLGPASAPRQRGCWKRHRARPSRVFSIHMDCGPCFSEETWSSCRDACDRRLLPITLRRAPTTNRRPPCGVASTKLPTSLRALFASLGAKCVQEHGALHGAPRASDSHVRPSLRRVRPSRGRSGSLLMISSSSLERIGAWPRVGRLHSETVLDSTELRWRLALREEDEPSKQRAPSVRVDFVPASRRGYPRALGEKDRRIERLQSRAIVGTCPGSKIRFLVPRDVRLRVRRAPLRRRRSLQRAKPEAGSRLRVVIAHVASRRRAVRRGRSARLATRAPPNVRAELESRGFRFVAKTREPLSAVARAPHCRRVVRLRLRVEHETRPHSTCRRASFDACRSDGARLAANDTRKIRAAVPPAKEDEAGANRGAFGRPDDDLRAFAAGHFACGASCESDVRTAPFLARIEREGGRPDHLLFRAHGDRDAFSTVPRWSPPVRM